LCLAWNFASETALSSAAFVWGIVVIASFMASPAAHKGRGLQNPFIKMKNAAMMLSLENIIQVARCHRFEVSYHEKIKAR